jgi:hypothetical protein
LDEAKRSSVAEQLDPPTGAGGELLAGDETIGQPAVHGGGRHTEGFGRFGDGDQVAVGGSGGRLIAGDVLVVAQSLDDGG